MAKIYGSWYSVQGSRLKHIHHKGAECTESFFSVTGKRVSGLQEMPEEDGITLLKRIDEFSVIMEICYEHYVAGAVGLSGLRRRTPRPALWRNFLR